MGRFESPGVLMLPKRKSLRLPNHDYACGWYFVTICTKDKRPSLGTVVGGRCPHRPACGTFKYRLCRRDVSQAHPRHRHICCYAKSCAFRRIHCRGGRADVGIGPYASIGKSGAFFQNPFNESGWTKTLAAGLLRPCDPQRVGLSPHLAIYG